MAKKNQKATLQVGEATTETTPVAAIIEMDGMYGLQKFFFDGKDAHALIEQLHQYQDLYCLCRMAPQMGTPEDADVAQKLEEFLFSSYEIDDFDKFDFPFSIGHIKCTGWAKGEENMALLKQMHEGEQK